MVPVLNRGAHPILPFRTATPNGQTTRVLSRRTGPEVKLGEVRA